MDKAIRLTPLILFVAYLVKSLIVSVSLADAGIVGALVALTVYFDWAVNKKQISALEKKVAEMDATHKEEIEFVKNNVSSLKISSGLKTTYTQR